MSEAVELLRAMLGRLGHVASIAVIVGLLSKVAAEESAHHDGLLSTATFESVSVVCSGSGSG
ncbi:MAG: hypothetical protein H0W72_10860 [Planctomycetes bacterium]|nr:hypothetical protein [Planctomycetota bacterium]